MPKLQTLLMPAAAVLAAWTLLPLPEAPAFKLTGEALRVGNRDLRVHNNFSDPEANANQIPHPSFPGYVGAEMAIWKAAVEWGSGPHFLGEGDPTQPFDLGSGNSNFEFSWQGRADDPGGPNDNVHSELGGQSNGVVAFTETPTGNGWRIRYYRHPWIFYDNPNGYPTVSQSYDLQGVACHELGHALGLGHTNQSGQTMSTNSPHASGWRSIEADDIKGLQLIYGQIDPSKPRVDTYRHLAGGMLSIRGTGFHATQNEVWFTQAGSGGDGTPVTVSGLASSGGGTEIVLQVPAAAGPGDLLVKLPGPYYSTLSNAFPFDTTVGPCPAPIPYGTGKLNSSGNNATIGWTGTPNVAGGSFHITLAGGPISEPGLVFWGQGKKASPFYGGWMLCTPPHTRGPSFTTGLGGDATVALSLDPSMVGATRYYQVWFRDSLVPAKAGTSNALEVTFCE